MWVNVASLRGFISASTKMQLKVVVGFSAGRMAGQTKRGCELIRSCLFPLKLRRFSLTVSFLDYFLEV